MARSREQTMRIGEAAAAVLYLNKVGGGIPVLFSQPGTGKSGIVPALLRMMPFFPALQQHDTQVLSIIWSKVNDPYLSDDAVFSMAQESENPFRIEQVIWKDSDSSPIAMRSVNNWQWERLVQSAQSIPSRIYLLVLDELFASQDLSPFHNVFGQRVLPNGEVLPDNVIMVAFANNSESRLSRAFADRLYPLAIRGAGAGRWNEVFAELTLLNTLCQYERDRAHTRNGQSEKGPFSCPFSKPLTASQLANLAGVIAVSQEEWNFLAQAAVDTLSDAILGEARYVVRQWLQPYEMQHAMSSPSRPSNQKIVARVNVSAGAIPTEGFWRAPDAYDVADTSGTEESHEVAATYDGLARHASGLTPRKDGAMMRLTLMFAALNIAGSSVVKRHGFLANIFTAVSGNPAAGRLAKSRYLDMAARLKAYRDAMLSGQYGGRASEQEATFPDYAQRRGWAILSAYLTIAASEWASLAHSHNADLSFVSALSPELGKELQSLLQGADTSRETHSETDTGEDSEATEATERIAAASATLLNWIPAIFGMSHSAFRRGLQVVNMLFDAMQGETESIPSYCKTETCTIVRHCASNGNTPQERVDCLLVAANMLSTSEVSALSADERKYHMRALLARYFFAEQTEDRLAIPERDQLPQLWRALHAAWRVTRHDLLVQDSDARASVLWYRTAALMSRIERAMSGAAAFAFEGGDNILEWLQVPQ